MQRTKDMLFFRLSHGKIRTHTAGYNPSVGRQIQRSVAGKTQKEVAAKLRQITRELDQNTYHAPSRITLERWLKTWSTDYLNERKPSTTFL